MRHGVWCTFQSTWDPDSFNRCSKKWNRYDATCFRSPFYPFPYFFLPASYRHTCMLSFQPVCQNTSREESVCRRSHAPAVAELWSRNVIDGRETSWKLVLYLELFFLTVLYYIFVGNAMCILSMMRFAFAIYYGCRILAGGNLRLI